MAKLLMIASSARTIRLADGAPDVYAQVVTAQGAVWAPTGDSGLLPGTAAAEQVAVSQRGSYYTETTLAGVRAMVLTTPLAKGLAVQLAVPLTAVDAELGNIGTTLALLSVAGASLAALAGWGIARAGLAPVGRLAVVAEQVTATGDPSRRVEVDRADELGRLAASFNAMLAALQRSLAAQRQLVSDASHELRTPLTSLRVNAELLAAEPGLPEEERRPQPPGQRGQVQRAGRHGAGAPAGRRADRTRPRTRDLRRRPAARVRPLLPGHGGPRRARLRPRAVHRGAGSRRPRRNGPDRVPARRRDADPVPPTAAGIRGRRRSGRGAGRIDPVTVPARGRRLIRPS